MRRTRSSCSTPVQRGQRRRCTTIAALFLVLVCCLSASTFAETRDDVDFVATEEWQELLPHQRIPKGLHIRMDMSTGKKFAKLVDPEENDKPEQKAVLISPESNTKETRMVASLDQCSAEGDGECAPMEDEAVGTETNVVTTKEQDSFMESVLLSLPDVIPTELQNEAPGKTLEELKQKLSPEQFRILVRDVWKKRQSALKEAMDAMRDGVKFLQEQIILLNNESHTTADYLEALRSIEAEIEDIDKAADFFTLGGLPAVLPHLNSTSLDVRAQAAWVLGTSCKHDTTKQDRLLEVGTLQRLLSLLKQDTSGSSAINVQRKALYAIGILVTHNTNGQQQFLAASGPEKLLSLLHPRTSQTKISSKVIDIVIDLLEEAPVAPSSPLEHLHLAFTSPEWCNEVLHESLWTEENNVFREKVLRTVRAMKTACEQSIEAWLPQLQERSKVLEGALKAAAADGSSLDDEGDFASSLITLCEELRRPSS